MISLKQSYEIEYNGTENCARMDLYADTAADLTGLTHFDSIKLLQGSDALDISTGDHWILQSGGSWIRQPSDNAWSNVYTKSEIDALLSAKQDQLTWAASTVKDGEDAMFSGGIWQSVWSQIYGVNSIQNLAQDVPEGGYDANTLLDVGVYRVPSAAVAANIAHLPQQAAGRLIVLNVALSNRYIQIWIAAGARFFIRSYISTGWLHWHEYAGTDTGA